MNAPTPDTLTPGLRTPPHNIAAEKGLLGGLMIDNRAYEINDQALNLGSQQVNGERWVDLQQDMPGVSRRHCSLGLENGQCVLRDFSRYGTFLNGHQMDGSAVLQIGDQVRLGTPGFELRLIATATEQDSGA